MKKWLSGIYYSFPIQLLVLQLRSNLLLLVAWALLFSIISGGFGRHMGFHYMFLDPEYLGEVGFWSFFIVGLAFGLFYISWNTSIYILNSYRFPFLASLNRPLGKFSFNNGLLPLFFVLFYIFNILQFQWYNEFAAEGSLLSYCLGFLAGLSTTLMLSTGYFYITNRDIVTYSKRQRLKISAVLKGIVVKHRERQLQLAKHDPYKDAVRVDYFLTEAFRPRIVRDVRHYNFKLLERVFRQNHANALVIQTLSITAMILMSALVEYPVFRIPVAASILILLSIITTIIGALTYWMQEWRTFLLIVMIILSDQMISRGWFRHENRAYGLNYQTQPASYTYETLDSIANLEQYRKDFKNTIKILDNWRDKFGRRRLLRKPKMVVVCSSGGGARAGLWTMQVLREIDKQLDGKLMKHTMLMTGASGGMFGATYFRELYLRKQLGEAIDMQDPKYLDNISKDLANALSFTFIVNDIFVPWINREVNGYTYKQDRGYIFEQQFIENTDGLLGKNIGYYRAPEENSLIPMMLFTPVVTSDKRFMVISPHRVSYMMRPAFTLEKETEFAEIDGIDFGAFFEKQDAYNLRVATAVRMSATFPFIMPNVYMPTEPSVEVMDAGLRDNFGIESAVRFLTIFRAWIRENTSGVTIIQIRAFEKISNIPKKQDPSLGDLLNPVSPLFSVDDTQDFHHDNYIAFLKSKIGYGKVDLVRFAYRPSKLEERASLSLHLTKREKNDILSALYLEENQESLQRIKELVK